MPLFLALLSSIVAESRATTAPTAVRYVGWLPLAGSPPAFMPGGGAWLFTALAEFITGRLPRPPSREVPIQFGARVEAGSLSGVTVAATGVSFAAGVVGAIASMFSGASLRARLAAFFGEDRSAALIEDVIAILAVLLIVSVP